MSGSSESSALVSVNTILIEEGKDYLLEPGDELPYRLVRNLGHGHSGNVEEVEDIHTGAVYARKTIRLYGSRDNTQRRQIFDNETKILRSLASHHHIVQIFATYAAKREVGLILQPVADDGDLDAFLDRFREDAEESEATDGRKVAHQTKIAILERSFGCLASGLEFMHRLGVRHKDIKPRNILIHQGLVLYADFGYSLDFSESNHSTTTGQPGFLTRRYSAPEVLGHESRNSYSDIFSLGCVFIEILSVLEMDLNIDQGLCFGEDINRIHHQLGKCKTKTSTSFLAELSGICISMTQRKPSSRSTASQVLSNIQRNPGYLCELCQLEGARDGDNETQRAGSSFLQKVPNSISVIASSKMSTPMDDSKSADELVEDRSVREEESLWTWSDAHQDYYYATLDDLGQWTYHWSKQMPLPPPDVIASSKIASLTIHDTRVSPGPKKDGIPTSSSDPERPVVGPAETTRIIPGMIHGKSENSWYHPLDNSYRLRTGIEAYLFFVKGKVFAMLHTQTSTDLAGLGNDNATVVKYGEKAFSQVRRFVVVKVRNGFVNACPISTYSNRGTLKSGVDPREHSIVHFVGTEPVPLQGEKLTRDPIAIMPAAANLHMSSTSRLHYAKVYPIEMNVKVKEIGDVIPEDLPKLISYYREQNEP